MIKVKDQPENRDTAGKEVTIMPSQAKAGTQPPAIETVHANISLANTYRLELTKTMLAISAALFAFTISFPPALTRIDQIDVLVWGWVALGVSTIGGLLNLYGWEKFYISYRDYHNDYDAGQRYRKWITLARRSMHLAQMLGMMIGIAALAWFVTINRANVKLAETREVGSSSLNANAPPLAPKGR